MKKKKKMLKFIISIMINCYIKSQFKSKLIMLILTFIILLSKSIMKKSKSQVKYRIILKNEKPIFYLILFFKIKYKYEKFKYSNLIFF